VTQFPKPSEELILVLFLGPNAAHLFKELVKVLDWPDALFSNQLLQGGTSFLRTGPPR
jgi:hypothetical protein